MSIFKSLFGSNKEEKERLQKENEEKERLRKEKQIENELKQKEEKRKRKEVFYKKKSEILKKLDGDENGVIDLVEVNDDLMKLVKKHQKKITEIDNINIHHFVKVSEYLKTKRSNIQQIFVLVRRVKSETQLDNRLGILNNQIHSYKVLLLYSLNMVTSVVEGDLIKYYEIYEKFDKLNLFNSNHENEMSKKLSDVNKSIEQVNRNLNKIENGITGLLESIDRMEMNILGQLDYLTYVTEDSFSELEESLSRELGSINSSIQTNNLLTGIQTYQLYKINKNTKGLRE